MSNDPRAGLIYARSTRRTVLGGMAAGGALALTGCGFIGDSVRYRYRLTVEVDTPEGLRSGSSVIQVDTSESKGLEGSHLDVRVTGDAVAVDLPDGQTLFALLDKPALAAPNHAIDPHLPELPNSEDWWKRDGERLRSQSGMFELPRMGPSPFPNDPMIDQWPTLVHFRDIRDPQTVERVDPDNPAATLGPGIRIRRIIVQMTDDPVTTGIEKKLPWLHGYRQWMNVGGADFGADSFSTEAFK